MGWGEGWGGGGAGAFLECRGRVVGLQTRHRLGREEPAAGLGKPLGEKPKAFLFGPEETQTIGIVTGGAGSEIYGPDAAIVTLRTKLCERDQAKSD